MERGGGAGPLRLSWSSGVEDHAPNNMGRREEVHNPGQLGLEQASPTCLSALSIDLAKTE